MFLFNFIFVAAADFEGLIILVMFKSIKHPDNFCLVFLQEGMVAKLVEQPEKGADQDSRVIIAYIHQCTAEAQEGKPRK